VQRDVSHDARRQQSVKGGQQRRYAGVGCCDVLRPKHLEQAPVEDRTGESRLGTEACEDRRRLRAAAVEKVP